MKEVVQEIIEAKHNVGPDAYLWLHSSGNCILWLHEEGHDGGFEGAITRWQLTNEEQKELILTGEVSAFE